MMAAAATSTPISPVKFLRPPTHTPGSPLWNITADDFQTPHSPSPPPSPSSHPNASNQNPTQTSTASTARAQQPFNLAQERQHLRDPLCGRTHFFTADRERIDLDEINGAWLQGKEKSQQARLVLAEKRMLRRLTAKFT